jgi:hypothetical protein
MKIQHFIKKKPSLKTVLETRRDLSNLHSENFTYSDTNQKYNSYNSYNSIYTEPEHDKEKVSEIIDNYRIIDSDIADDTFSDNIRRDTYINDSTGRIVLKSIEGKYDGCEIKNTLLCNLCTLYEIGTLPQFIVVSCCNRVYHIKCIAKQLRIIDETSNKQCPGCSGLLEPMDYLNIIKKIFNSNQILKEEYSTNMTELTSQIKKIQNEIEVILTHVNKLDMEQGIYSNIMSNIVTQELNHTLKHSTHK